MYFCTIKLTRVVIRLRCKSSLRKILPVKRYELEISGVRKSHSPAVLPQITQSTMSHHWKNWNWQKYLIFLFKYRLFSILSYFHNSTKTSKANSSMKWTNQLDAKMLRMCALGFEPRPQDGRHRRIHWAMEAKKTISHKVRRKWVAIATQLKPKSEYKNFLIIVSGWSHFTTGIVCSS